MLTPSLFFTTLIVLFTSVSAGATATGNTTDIVVNVPSSLVQCANSTITWSGGVAPYVVNIYTGCDSSDDTPVASFNGVSTQSLNWFVTQFSGATLFIQVIDSANSEAFSNDCYVGGSTTNTAGCKAIVSAAQASSRSVAATATTSAAGGAPTTMSQPAGAGGVANNAAKVSTPASSATSTTVATNGAGSIVARPVEVAVALAALGLAALF